MSKRAVHLHPWDGGTEADQDPPEHVFCGTGGDMTDDKFANDWIYVTCKRCLKSREKSWQRAPRIIVTGESSCRVTESKCSSLGRAIVLHIDFGCQFGKILTGVS